MFLVLFPLEAMTNNNIQPLLRTLTNVFKIMRAAPPLLIAVITMISLAIKVVKHLSLRQRLPRRTLTQCYQLILPQTTSSVSFLELMTVLGDKNLDGSILVSSFKTLSPE